MFRNENKTGGSRGRNKASQRAIPIRGVLPGARSHRACVRDVLAMHAGMAPTAPTGVATRTSVAESETSSPMRSPADEGCGGNVIQVAHPCRVSAAAPTACHRTDQLRSARTAVSRDQARVSPARPRNTPRSVKPGARRKCRHGKGGRRACVPVVSTREPLPAHLPSAVPARGSSRERSRYPHLPRSGGGHRCPVPLPVPVNGESDR